MNLQDCRDQIDQIDAQITDLLQRRFEIVRKIGEYKQKNGMAVCDKSREDEILAKIDKQIPGLSAPVTAVYQTVLEQSKKLQNK